MRRCAGGRGRRRGENGSISNNGENEDGGENENCGSPGTRAALDFTVSRALLSASTTPLTSAPPLQKHAPSPYRSISVHPSALARTRLHSLVLRTATADAVCTALEALLLPQTFLHQSPTSAATASRKPIASFVPLYAHSMDDLFGHYAERVRALAARQAEIGMEIGHCSS